MAERQFGPYRLVKQIAVGGMAEIHLAKTKGLAGFEKYVALKMIHPNFAEDEQFIQMLVDEAKIAVQLTHANIAQTFDLGRVGDTYYITMEFVDGSDLYKVLRRASEIDVEMPLDVCAFIARDMTTALDHAHRKKDAYGKPLQIVHRDVSPQNVLVSYAGEVKLVDFGIAKATSKAKQTAVGVIKGKYYYMSPEQAWGDPIDLRSDIFSAGIVLYEMMTGQMLYLEEDLHKLLDMVRKADIAPPSTLRKGIPPQLEKIVMHALRKVPGERYQNAGDFATDLERFLHAYAPVFTASKVAALLRQIIGEPGGVAAEDPEIEVRSGLMSTHELNAEDLAHAGDELRDENSMIFNVEELKAAAQKQAAPPPKPVAPAPAAKPVPKPVAPKPAIPSIKPAPVVVKQPAPMPRLAKPRDPDEQTREVGHTAPAAADDDSGLIPVEAKKWDQTATEPGEGDDDNLENIGERTMITAPDFMKGVGGGGGGDDELRGEATMITQAPAPERDTQDEPIEDQDHPDNDEEFTSDNDDGPTIQRDYSNVPKSKRAVTPAPIVKTPKPVLSRNAKPPPAALAANIQTPSVSALRTPKPSRRTPPGGNPIPNVLQAIVHSAPAEAMPAPAPLPRAQAKTQPPPMPTPPKSTGPTAVVAQQPPPLAAPPLTPPPGAIPYTPPQQQHQPQQPPWGHTPNPWEQQPPQYYQQQPPQQPYYQQQQQQPYYPSQQPLPMAANMVSPNQLYGYQPPGQPQPYGVTLTGALRIAEADNAAMASLGSGARNKWLFLVFGSLVAIAAAALITFAIVRGSRDAAPDVATIKVESSPAGADVYYDDSHLSQQTPVSIDSVPGTHHDIRVDLAHYKPYAESVDIPKLGGTVPVMALLKKLTGTIVINSKPAGADIRINGELRGRTPATLSDIDMESAKTVEVGLKGYQPVRQDLAWTSSSRIELDLKLEK